MIVSLLRFEWRFHTRQRSFLAAVILVCGFSVMLVASGFGELNLYINSPYVIFQGLSLSLLSGIFVSAVLCSNAVLRDDENAMTEIIFATPTSPRRLLWIRFAGVWLAVVSVYTLATIVLAVASLLFPVAPERAGPLHLEYYLWTLFTLVIPTLTLMVAVLFAIALQTRNALATMVAAIVMYGGYMMIAAVTGSPLMAASRAQSAAALTSASLVDPFGITAIYQQARYWTMEVRNTQMIALTGTFLTNRLIWTGVAVGVMALVNRRGLRARSSAPREKVGALRSLLSRVVPSRFRQPSAMGHARHATPDDTPIARKGSMPMLGHAPSHKAKSATAPTQFRAALRAARSIATMDSRYLLASKPAIVILVVWAILILTELLSATLYAEYGTELMRTSAIFVEALQQPMVLFGSVVLIFFGPEVVWRARGAHMDSLLDATPTGNAVRIIGHFGALAAMMFVLTVLGVVLAVVLQLVQGESPVEPLVYASVLGSSTLPLVLTAVAILFVQTLSPNRYVGTIAALAFVMLQQTWTPFGIDHPLLRYAAAPGWVYSDVAGFGVATTSYWAFMAYWTAVAALLIAFATALWHRGHPTSFLSRLSSTPRASRSSIKTIVGLFVLTVGIGSWLVVATVFQGDYRTRNQTQNWRAAYEKTYEQRIPESPAIKAIATTIDLFPETRRYAVSGQYTIYNQTSAVVDTVWLTFRREAENAEATLNDRAPVLIDDTFGMRAFVPSSPMQVGDSAVVKFSFDRDESGIRAAFAPNVIRPNGTYLELRRILPSVGYRLGYTILDERVRAEYGLAPIDTDPVLEQELIESYDMTLSTSADQTPVASGRLVAESTADGRHKKQFRIDGPIPNILYAASARYNVARVEQGGISIEVYHHPSHQENIQRMLVAAEHSLEYMTSRFSEYPHGVLRIAEVPASFPGAAFATPGAIYFAEDRGFLTRAPSADGLDLIARRTAHEVSHQWWGHQLAPARAPGSLLFVESFAKYVEQRIVAIIQDEARAESIRAYDHERYLRGRTGAEGTEESLITMEQEDYLFYGKGAIVLSALRDLVGAASLESTMRSLLPDVDSTASRVAASEFMYRLERGLPASDSLLVAEWLGGVTLYDLAVDSATVRTENASAQSGNGTNSSSDADSLALRVYVTATKFDTETGHDQPVPMDELIEITVTSVENRSGTVVYRGHHRIQSGSNELVLAVPFSAIMSASMSALTSATSPTASTPRMSTSPTTLTVHIDPGFHRIDRERTNNSARVKGR